MGRCYRRMTEKDRYAIACLCQSGYAVAQIAKTIGYSRQAVDYEIRKGTLLELDGVSKNEKSGYDYAFAQRLTDILARKRGRRIKMEEDADSLEAVKTLIEEGYSPYAALIVADNSGRLKTKVSTMTLYRYIHKGVLDGLEKRLKKYKRADTKPDFGQRADATSHTSYKSISERPQSVLSRLEFGHWEGDTVVGKKGTKECLFTLVERKTRFAIAVKVPDRSQRSIVEALDALERVFGDLFRRIFKSITFDNGVEFYDVESMTRSQFGGSSPPRRIGEVYFAHPYCSSERGSNENMHRFIRRPWPKGTSWSDVDAREVVRYMDWVNNYPRALLGGKCAKALFAQELSML